MMATCFVGRKGEGKGCVEESLLPTDRSLRGAGGVCTVLSAHPQRSQGCRRLLHLSPGLSLPCSPAAPRCCRLVGDYDLQSELHTPFPG